MIKLMEKEFISVWMELNIKESGLLICKMVMEKKHVQMEQFIKGVI